MTRITYDKRKMTKFHKLRTKVSRTSMWDSFVVRLLSKLNYYAWRIWFLYYSTHFPQSEQSLE